MINIITSRHKDLLENSQLEYIECPWVLFEDISSLIYNSGEYSEITNILREVEDCKMIESNNGIMFQSKFNGVPLKLSFMSTGSQIVICIYYLASHNDTQDKIIDITNCGSNAIKYILQYYNKYDITLYLDHIDISDELNTKFLLNGEPVDSLSSILKEWEQ